MNIPLKTESAKLFEKFRFILLFLFGQIRDILIRETQGFNIMHNPLKTGKTAYPLPNGAYGNTPQTPHAYDESH